MGMIRAATDFMIMTGIAVLCMLVTAVCRCINCCCQYGFIGILGQRSIGIHRDSNSRPVGMNHFLHKNIAAFPEILKDFISYNFV